MMISGLISITLKIFKPFKDLALLFLRLLLAYGLYGPAVRKLSNFADTISWFKELGIPMPELSLTLATAAEIAGVIFLAFGFLTRLVSLPLMVVMCSAIAFVHGLTHFSHQENGFEIPLYYLIMLFVLLSHGAGKYSLDYLIRQEK
jgi:putative oxidoreductase